MPHYDRHSAVSFVPNAAAKAEAREEELDNAAAALREAEVEAAQPPRGDGAECGVSEPESASDSG